VYGHNYIKYLNLHIAAVTCCANAKTPYIIGKFFEIPASGTLLLAYDEHAKEPLKGLGFVDGENYISTNYNNFVEKVIFVTKPQKSRDS
jgi:aspartokinase